jgi:protein-S-isoprenylcysteine O-methyltransferase Ste14
MGPSLPICFTFWSVIFNLRWNAAELDSRQAHHLAGRMWLVWLIIWLALAFFSKSTKRRESGAERMQHVIPVVLGCMLVFNEGFGGTWVSRRIFPGNPSLLLICVAVTALGLLFSLWARFALGSNWSGAVTIKDGHQLIREGPYRRIRHPIYTGLLAAFLATAVAQGLVSGILGFVLVAAGIYRKALREERFLAQEFGESFVEHRRHTGMFLPRFS